ncbi:hypothetical protein [Achromobacter insolitus]|uniref:hypothetical protein n=1 Tax=Achromobacter insolitus TaxID=217204 RepID=UPI0036713AAC
MRFRINTVRRVHKDVLHDLESGSAAPGIRHTSLGGKTSASCRATGPGEVVLEWSADLPFEDGHLDKVSPASFVVPSFLAPTISEAWRALFPDWNLDKRLSVGLIHSGVALNLMLSRSAVDSWLFQKVPVAARRDAVDLAVGVFLYSLPAEGFYVNRALRGLSTGFNRATASLIDLQPISLEVPFVLVGLSLTPVIEPKFFELEAEPAKRTSAPVIERVIEVPQQYQQAVVGILGYFGTYLQQIAPEQAKTTKIRIEQGAGFLRLVVEAEDGARHILERAFDDYQGVVTGSLSVDQLSLSPFAAAELRNELRMANMRIEFQKDMLAAQGLQLKTLRELTLELSKRDVPDVTIQVSNVAQASATSSLDMRSLVGEIHSLVQKLQPKEAAREIAQELSDVGDAIEGAGQEQAALKGPMDRLRGVLEKLQSTGTRLRRLLDDSDGVLDSAQKLAKKYNAVAEWCGLPQIPRAFTGRND